MTCELLPFYLYDRLSFVNPKRLNDDFTVEECGEGYDSNTLVEVGSVGTTAVRSSFAGCVFSLCGPLHFGDPLVFPFHFDGDDTSVCGGLFHFVPSDFHPRSHLFQPTSSGP